MKKIFKAVGNYLDDLFYLFGIGWVTYGVTLIYKPAGFITLGALMIVYSILIAKSRR